MAIEKCFKFGWNTLMRLWNSSCAFNRWFDDFNTSMRKTIGTLCNFTITVKSHFRIQWNRLIFST